MDERVNKGEARGAEGDRRPGEASPESSAYRPGSLSKALLQVRQQNT